MPKDEVKKYPFRMPECFAVLCVLSTLLWPPVAAAETTKGFDYLDLDNLFKEPEGGFRKGDLRFSTPDKKHHIYVPREITEKKDCDAYRKFRDEVSLLIGFMNVGNFPCPWEPLPGKVAHFTLNKIAFDIPRDYLYINKAAPDGEAEGIYAELSFPSMEPAMQSRTTLLRDDVVVANINGAPFYWTCRDGGKCHDYDGVAFRGATGLRSAGRRIRSYEPKNKEQFREDYLKCKPLRDACTAKYPEIPGKVRTDAMREREEKVFDCWYEHDVCRPAPPKKVGKDEVTGLDIYKYNTYEENENFLIEGDPLAATYWLKCSSNVERTVNQCKSAFDMGALRVNYYFVGSDLLKNHREVRERLREAITKMARPEDREFLVPLSTQPLEGS